MNEIADAYKIQLIRKLNNYTSVKVTCRKVAISKFNIGMTIIALQYK